MTLLSDLIHGTILNGSSNEAHIRTSLLADNVKPERQSPSEKKPERHSDEIISTEISREDQMQPQQSGAREMDM